MRENLSFIVTLWFVIFAAWSVSGEQFLDLVFAMPDLGPIDDWAIAVAVRLEDARALMSPPDLFVGLRSVLHQLMGLN